MLTTRRILEGRIGGNFSNYRKVFLTITIALLIVIDLLRLQFSGPDIGPFNLAILVSLSVLCAAVLWLRFFAYSSLVVVFLALGLLGSEGYIFIIGESIYSSFYLWVAVAIVFTGLMANLRFALFLCVVASAFETYMISENGKFGHSLGSIESFPLFVKGYAVSLVLAEIFLVATLVTFKSMRDRMLRDLHQLKLDRTRATLTAAIGEMVGKLAHELNNPLAIIDGCIIRCKAILARDIPDDKSRTLLWKRMSDALLRIQNVLSKINSISQEDPHTAFSSVDVRSFLTRLGHSIEKARWQGLHFVWKVPDSRLSIDCRQDQIDFVLSVLFDNARDSVMGQSNAQISLCIKAVANAVHFEIEDNGEGVSEDAAERLFQPFFSTKSVSGSLGMNLYVCHCIIGQHNGRIGFSRIKSGAAFWFELPILP